MPDPIQCSRDLSQPVPTYDCQPLDIASGAEETNQCFAEPNQTLRDGEESLEPEPQAVSSLVKAVTPERATMPPAASSERAFPPPPVALPSAVVAITHCPSPILDIGLVVAAARTGAAPVVVLAGVKLGADLAQCLSLQLNRIENERAERAAEDFCRTDGGEPRQWIGNRLECVVKPEVTP